MQFFGLGVGSLSDCGTVSNEEQDIIGWKPLEKEQEVWFDMSNRRQKKRKGDVEVGAEPGKVSPSVGEDMWVEFVCPITRMLPIQPVLGPDKRVYEKFALERYLKNPTAIDESGLARSPVTGEGMPPVTELQPMPFVSRAIGRWIDAGYLVGEEAVKWKEANEKLEMVQKAERGSGEEQYNVGILFFYGDEDGYFPEDEKEAFKWFEKARANDSVKGEAMVGGCMLDGTGTAKKTVRATHILAKAAGDGSNYAAYRLSTFFGNNTYSAKDAGLEEYYLRLAVKPSAPHKHLSLSLLFDARKRLADLCAIEISESVDE